jgi:hypothetical protein
VADADDEGVGDRGCGHPLDLDEHRASPCAPAALDRRKVLASAIWPTRIMWFSDSP